MRKPGPGRKFKPGDPRPAGAGRKKGTPNHTTVVLKEAIMRAFDAKGGHKYLIRIADEEPRAFCMLLAKIIPHEIRAEIASSAVIIAAIREGRERADRLRQIDG